MNDHTTNDTTVKLCECGCGQPAPLATRTDHKKGMIKGQPFRFIRGHFAHTLISNLENPNPSGLCMCGCGLSTPIAKKTSTRTNQVKGYPIRFVYTHQTRPRDVSIEDSFWARVNKNAPNGCWEWMGAKTKSGYGNVFANGRYHNAHRFVWKLVNGPIPDKMVICHHCDNHPCCNPEHLFLGTQADNLRDMYMKGRQNHTTYHKPSSYAATTVDNGDNGM